jgi:hypothetical protein
MKRPFVSLAFLALGAVAISTVGCNDPLPGNEPQPKLNFVYNGSPYSNLSITDVSTAGRTITLFVDANVDWAMTPLGTDVDWVSVSPETGPKGVRTTVKIVVEKNTSEVTNSIDLVFKSVGEENISGTVKITQKASEPEPEPEPEPYDGKIFTQAALSYFGDYFEIGMANLTLEMMTSDRYYVGFDLLVPLADDPFDTEFPARAYVFDEESFGDYTFWWAEAGLINDDGKLEGVKVTNGQCTVAYNGETCTVEVDVTLATGETLKGKYVGPLSIFPDLGKNMNLNFTVGAIMFYPKMPSKFLTKSLGKTLKDRKSLRQK